jgi:hypothetical protein
VCVRANNYNGIVGAEIRCISLRACLFMVHSGHINYLVAFGGKADISQRLPFMSTPPNRQGGERTFQRSYRRGLALRPGIA